MPQAGPGTRSPARTLAHGFVTNVHIWVPSRSDHGFGQVSTVDNRSNADPCPAYRLLNAGVRVLAGASDALIAEYVVFLRRTPRRRERRDPRAPCRFACTAGWGCAA